MQRETVIKRRIDPLRAFPSKKFFRSTPLHGHPLRCSNSKCPISHFFAPSVTHLLFRNGLLLVPTLPGFQYTSVAPFWNRGTKSNPFLKSKWVTLAAKKMTYGAFTIGAP